VVSARPRVLFVNGGILGLVAFHQFLKRALPAQSIIQADHIVLTDALTRPERAVRKLLAIRLWKDGAFGLANLDLLRFRMELFAGLLARRRIAARAAAAFDVLHFHRQATAYGSLDLLARIPSIVSIDSTQDCVMRPAAKLERLTYGPNLRIDGAIFRRAFALVAASQWAADSVREYYPDCRTPIHVMPTPVPLDLFDPAWVEARRGRAAAGVRPRLLFVGGDFPRKGGADLLAAWEAGGFHERATLDLVTDWPLGRVPAGVVVHRGVRAYTPEWIARWAAADGFVLPTRNEAFGLVYEEAAAAGLPAIGTRHNAVPELVKDDETGLLVGIGDRVALGHAMQRLIESAELRERFGRRARQIVEQIADPDTYLTKLTAIILEAARRS
jgi:glycosyltransferase involved in cell wall biosynthesis